MTVPRRISALEWALIAALVAVFTFASLVALGASPPS